MMSVPQTVEAGSTDGRRCKTGIRDDDPRVEQEKLVLQGSTHNTWGRRGGLCGGERPRYSDAGGSDGKRGEVRRQGRRGRHGGGHCARLLTLKNGGGHLVATRRHLHQEQKDTSAGGLGAADTTGSGRLYIAATGRERNSVCRGEKGRGGADNDGVGWVSGKRDKKVEDDMMCQACWSKTNVVWLLLAAWDVPWLKTAEHTTRLPNPNTNDRLELLSTISGGIAANSVAFIIAPSPRLHQVRHDQEATATVVILR